MSILPGGVMVVATCKNLSCKDPKSQNQRLMVILNDPTECSPCERPEKKGPPSCGCLGCIGDEILPFVIGFVISN